MTDTDRKPPVLYVGTITGRDPELRFTTGGKAITHFSLRIPGTRAKEGQEATEARFQEVNCWEQLGENVAESLRQGDRVVVRGVEKTRTYKTGAGEEKTVTEITAWNVGPDLSYATCNVVRNERKGPEASSGYGDI